MKHIVWVLLLGLQLLHADTNNIRVLNAASFVDGVSLAPGALISIFGQNLANTTALAPDLSNLPRTLGGVTVTVRGTALPLFYVTPGQINARIEAAAQTRLDERGLPARCPYSWQQIMDRAVEWEMPGEDEYSGAPWVWATPNWIVQGRRDSRDG